MDKLHLLDVLKGVGLVLYMLLERWLGKTEKVKQNSVVDVGVDILRLSLNVILTKLKNMKSKESK